MKLEMERVRSDKYYRVGYSSALGKYILACVVTWIAWYDGYYEISKEEYDSFGSDKLDELAEFLYKSGCKSERFLFSERNAENDSAQLKLKDRSER